MTHTDKRVLVSADASALAASVAGRLLSLVAAAAEHGDVHVAFGDDRSGAPVLETIGAHPARSSVDWSRVHFWWGDEGFVAADSVHRNERIARAALLSHIDVPAENIHAAPGSDAGSSLDDAADAYAHELARFGVDDHPWPDFDVCVLDVGTDGHIASLFPDRAEIQVRDRSVVPVRNAPEEPWERVTLTRPVINSAKQVWMVVSGADKAPALGLALAGASYVTVPAAGAKGRDQTTFYVDLSAASQVPDELIAQDD